MNVIWEILDLRMRQPIPYSSFSNSWFHYLSLILMVVSLIIFIKLFKNGSEKSIKKTLLITGILMIVLEIYKQVIFTYQANEYQWYAFPFQFCSTPMYLYVIYGLSKNKKLDSHLLSFLATFSTFAGLAVMFYPISVYVSTVGINIQTMVHHGLMASVGLALLATKTEFNLKTLFKASTVFIILMAVAYLLNTLFQVFINDGTFNMFFISPEFGTEIPILSMIQPHVPHIVFLIVYAVGFSFMALLMLFIGNLVYSITSKKNKQLVKVLE